MYKYGEKVKLEVSKELTFPEFKLTYLNEEDPEEGSEIRSTADVRIRNFLMRKDQQEVQFQVYLGQNPPEPVTVKLDNSSYTLYSFKTPNGENLFPDYFAIIKE